MNKGQFEALLEELRQMRELLLKVSDRISPVQPKQMTAPNDASKPGKGTQSAVKRRGRPKKAD